MKKAILILVAGLLVGCGDTIVEPTPLVIDLALEPSVFDGHWTGVFRDDDVQRWDVSWLIGNNGNTRTLSGNIKVQHLLTEFTETFTIEYIVGGGIVIFEEEELWQATVWLGSVWDIRGSLVNENTMEIKVSHFPEDVLFTLNRASSWLDKVEPAL